MISVLVLYEHIFAVYGEGEADITISPKIPLWYQKDKFKDGIVFYLGWKDSIIWYYCYFCLCRTISSSFSPQYGGVWSTVHTHGHHGKWALQVSREHPASEEQVRVLLLPLNTLDQYSMIEKTHNLWSAMNWDEKNHSLPRRSSVIYIVYINNLTPSILLIKREEREERKECIYFFYYLLARLNIHFEDIQRRI